MTRKSRVRSQGAGGVNVRRADLKPKKNPQPAWQLIANAQKQAQHDHEHRLVKGLTPEQEQMAARMAARRKKLTG